MAVFWNSTELKPKRSYQWVCYLNFRNTTGASKYDLPPFYIKNFRPPTINFDTREDNKNMEPGTHITYKNYGWEDIDISLYDVHSSKEKFSTTSKIYGWLQALGHKPVWNDEDPNTLIDNIASPAVFSMAMSFIDDNGKEYENWVLTKPYVLNVEFGDDMSYEADHISVVTLRIGYVEAHHAYGGGSLF